MRKGTVGAYLASVLLAGTLLGGCGAAQTQPGASVTGDEAVEEDVASTTATEAAVRAATTTEVDRARGVSDAVVVTDPASLVEEELPMYYRSADDERTIKVYFADEGHEIPYLDIDTMRQLLEDIYHDVNLDEGFGLTVTTDGHTATLTRENGYKMTVDADADSIYFIDYDAFFMPSSSPTVIDVLEHYGLIDCLRQVEDASYSRYGADVTFELAPYGIDVIERDGALYVPMQSFADICTSLTSYALFHYNGQCVCVEEYGMGDAGKDLLERYYAVAPTDEPRSDAIANFTYQELCMILDYCYGLSEQHDIDGFDSFFIECGLKHRLLDPDALESTKAIYDLVALYLSDGHSAFNGNSYRIGEDADTKTRFGKSFVDLSTSFKEYGEARAKAYPDGVPGYEEVGDTAYITFDAFDTLPKGVDYYKDAPTAESADTVGICLYAFSEITREGSPIRNVVLDLSNNHGGDSTTASFVLSMFLGQASVCVEDTLTGAYMNEAFCCDANLDGAFDEKDSLQGYRLFCMTSPCSFSCGNLVPSILQNSRKVRTIGVTSGGGACIVMPLTAADGTRLQISGNRRLGYMKNGSVYDIDRGVDPDYPISSIERFYDRPALTDFINSLY